MDVYSDECFELGALDLAEVTGGLVDERVEQLQEAVVGGLHDLAVVPGLLQGIRRIPGPQQLDTQQAHLS